MSNFLIQVKLKKPWQNKGLNYSKGETISVSIYKGAQLVESKMATCKLALPSVKELKKAHFAGLGMQAFENQVQEQLNELQTNKLNTNGGK